MLRRDLGTEVYIKYNQVTMWNGTSRKVSKSLESTETDIREDEEQTKKLQEIIDLLVAAGYFRARIKGLSNFDKVIGGITWCIESCNFDVDVDLLFRENLTIGQKISLTEKIVAMLPKMKCPYHIEPHQIQGLDCIHIFPVIQWLIKRSMEMRKEMAGFVRSLALNQFNKKHFFLEDENGIAVAAKKNMMQNILSVKRLYEPRRLFKYKDSLAKDESTRFLSTLLEYEANLHDNIQNTNAEVISLKSTTTLQENKKDNHITVSNDEKMVVKEIAGSMAVIEESSDRLSVNVVGNIFGMQAQEIAKVAEKYATKSISELEENGTSNMSSVLVTLQKQKANLQTRIYKLAKERDVLSSKISEIIDKTDQFYKQRELLERSFKKAQEIGINENDSIYKRLEELLLVHDGLREQELKFREQCKSDLVLLLSMLEEMNNVLPTEEEDRLKEYEEQKEIVTRARLQLAKKNRAIASLTRQLDDVPGRSELTQYQRRFMELYNQVSAKHKETKQYYTLYNTLDDTKLYLSKELSLLNSIQDNYSEAMASTSGKKQFLKQFEAIVAGVKRNKSMVEKRCADEKNRRDDLSQQLVMLIEQQRKYVVAVRQLTIECRKNEALLAQLRGS
ncbi:PREDICTED: coiled-coil domain-containing protein 93 isoform X1 [Polistes dominula]|uniref:Coiled-coil domain-containing protein 93 n=2 Tax=Polistes dominula TaxID=743375 RepID=A0ABM1J0F0_POLDO|nr:PREDICTED: coiled-coil domain-containing protein 93 isoform X1 [Polistes dominula]XP_015185938.1 PREDICTED: coiled-coil domain-containing protein 93 isoform X1 [Polistes dominula]XP_015185939.1 PREDICTED: coiled-coil domain-containing protein 93 isoform X1 [Polistes dominula]XP_015185940.1 PREDICTED: coiled-coil domain-containing protein 93 isoform X1 [Polistes dominula]